MRPDERGFFASATKSRYARLKTHRFILQIPACVTTYATARVEPEGPYHGGTI
jgi:hypothetical protein